MDTAGNSHIWRRKPDCKRDDFYPGEHPLKKARKVVVSIPGLTAPPSA